MRRAWRGAAIILALGLLFGAIAAYLLRPKPPPHLTLAPARYDQLVGWRDDKLAAVIPVLLRSCAGFLAKADTAALDAMTKSVDFGTVGEWRKHCAAAAALKPGDDEARSEEHTSELQSHSFIPY